MPWFQARKCQSVRCMISTLKHLYQPLDIVAKLARPEGSNGVTDGLNAMSTQPAVGPGPAPADRMVPRTRRPSARGR